MPIVGARNHLYGPLNNRGQTYELPKKLAVCEYEQICSRSLVFRKRQMLTMIDEYYHLFPDGDGNLLKRLRSKSARDRESAEFELLLYAMFRRSGCSLEVHPYVPYSSERPDFLVTTPDGTTFLLEATVVTGKSDQREKDEARVASLLASLGALRRDGFHLDFGIDGTPAKTIRTRAVVAQVKSWFDSLDLEAVRERTRYLKKHAERYPRLRLRRSGEEEQEWREPDPPSSPAEQISLCIPLDDECWLFASVSPENERPMSFSLSGTFWLNHPQKIRNKLSKKARNYGNLDKPLLVAVNMLCHFGSPLQDVGVEFSDEIFGYREAVFDEAGNLVDGTYVCGVLGPNANRKVSGVLVFTNFQLKTMKESFVRWMTNPWARLPLTSLPIGLPSFDAEANESDARPNAGRLLGWL